jgi:D-galactarolactone cycloisomerase
MRITSVKTHVVHCPIPDDQRVRSGAGLKLARQAAFVEIETDESLSGFGPCSFGSASLDLRAVASLMDNAMAPALIGEDPRRVSYLWEKIYFGSIVRVHGHRGLGVALISAIDIALWDIKGKALGAPIYDLLGGALHDPVYCYASSIYWGSPEETARQARAFAEERFKAMKLKVGLDWRNDIECLAAIRDEVGPGVDIMVDANQTYTRHLALRVGRELDRHQVMFFEEPLPIDDVEGHAFLAQRLDTRIATGENLYTRWGFLPFLEARGVHVVQADASRTGGISEAKRISDLAAAYHLHAAPHTFSDVLTIVANLHVAAASSNAVVLEVDRTYNPLQTQLAKNPPVIEDGYVQLPQGPGLGIEIDWDFVADHPYNGELGVGAGARPAFGLMNELLPDRFMESLR